MLNKTPLKSPSLESEVRKVFNDLSAFQKTKTNDFHLTTITSVLELKEDYSLSGTVHLKKSIVVMPDTVLTIEPNTKIVFGPDAMIYCMGSLQANGEEDSPILFKAEGEISGNIHLRGVPKNPNLFNYCKFDGLTGLSEKLFNQFNEDAEKGVSFSSGGAISGFGTSISISYSRFENNRAKKYGGAIDLRSSKANISHSYFDSNESLKEGGAVYAKDSQLNITNSNASKNVGFSGGFLCLVDSRAWFSDNNYGFNKSTNVGGVIAIKDSQVDSMHDEFYLNNSEMNGGVLWMSDSELSLKESNIIENASNHYGGVITSINSTLNISESYFEENKTKKSGGVLQLVNSEVVIDSSRFIRNEAELFSAGVFEAKDSTITIINSEYRLNTAPSSACFDLYDSTASIIDSVFDANHALAQGVGFARDSTLKLDNSSIVNNDAGIDSAAIVLEDSTYTHTRCEFANNTPKDVHIVRFDS